MARVVARRAQPGGGWSDGGRIVWRGGGIEVPRVILSCEHRVRATGSFRGKPHDGAPSALGLKIAAGRVAAPRPQGYLREKCDAAAAMAMKRSATTGGRGGTARRRNGRFAAHPERRVSRRGGGRRAQVWRPRGPRAIFRRILSAERRVKAANERGGGSGSATVGLSWGESPPIPLIPRWTGRQTGIYEWSPLKMDAWIILFRLKRPMRLCYSVEQRSSPHRRIRCRPPRRRGDSARHGV